VDWVSCSTSPIYWRDAEVGCCHQLPVYSTSANLDVSLSTIVYLLQQPAMDPWILAPRGPWAGPWLWNSLPDVIQSATSLTTFRQRQKLKTHLFRQSYANIVFNCIAIVVLEVAFT